MKKLILVTGCWIVFTGSFAQTIAQKLQKAYQQFEVDSQLSHAISSLYVINAKTGKVIFDKNSQIGLAPASTQKIITAVTAFELLGKDYRYKTQLGYGNGEKIQNEILNGNLYLLGTGDPTLGSWRWKNTRDTAVFEEWASAIKKAGIKKAEGPVWFASNNFSVQSIPDGWIWQDIGNYYGAGTNLLNWKENQYDILFNSPPIIGSGVKIVLPEDDYINEVISAPKGTGDNAYAYYDKVITGTIPAGESSFKISAARIDPVEYLCVDFARYLSSIGISTEPMEKNYRNVLSSAITPDSPFHLIGTHYSPALDSIVYWFLQKSINLYGEALIKTFAYEKKDFGSTDSGVAILKDFWKQKGIDEDELNISDGSGLSPQNRVTTHAQVEILKYAKTRGWFPYFYAALPEYNSMKMKSGSIKDVKGFCGYQKSKDGNEYIFSFLVNNYNGPSSGLVNKMYQVLDILK